VVAIGDQREQSDPDGLSRVSDSRPQYKTSMARAVPGPRTLVS